MSTLKNTYSSSNISKSITFDKHIDGSSTANTVNDFTFLQKEGNEWSESKKNSHKVNEYTISKLNVSISKKL